MGQNESTSSEKDRHRATTNNNDNNSTTKGRTSSSSSSSFSAIPQHNTSSLIKQSPSPSPPSIISTLAQLSEREEASDDEYSFTTTTSDHRGSDWASDTKSIPQSSSRTKHLVFDDGIEVSFEENESPPKPKLFKSFKSEMSTSTSVTTTSTTTTTTTTEHPRQSDVIEDGCFVHLVKKNDTLQGIALTYRVKVEDIKTKNKLWSKNDLFGRKKLLIPLSAQVSSATSSNTSRSEVLSSEDLDRLSLISRFIRDLKSSEEIALYYLERSNWNYSLSVDNYIDDIRNSVIVAPTTSEKSKKNTPSGEVVKLDTSQQKVFDRLEDDIYEL